MLIYTKLANKYLIFDKPNERSSHVIPTIRGGGIVFLLSILFTGFMYHPVYWVPILGACLIGIISFLDDNMEVSKGIRFVFHLFSVTLLFIFLDIFSKESVWAIIALYILVAGIINAYNFMDGINGITGLYSLVVLGALQYVNLYQHSFIEANLIWFPILACLVFLFYNFRAKAKIFAGDVGSITMAFWVIFLIFDLILDTNNWVYILFLTVYGVDTVLTIAHRLLLKQNIFEAHRLHFYQILANEQKVPHRVVAVIYAVLQALIIVLVLFTNLSFLSILLLSSLPLVAFYILMKPRFMANPKPAKIISVQNSPNKQPALVRQ